MLELEVDRAERDNLEAEIMGGQGMIEGCSVVGRVE